MYEYLRHFGFNVQELFKFLSLILITNLFSILFQRKKIMSSEYFRVWLLIVYILRMVQFHDCNWKGIISVLPIKDTIVWLVHHSLEKINNYLIA